MSLVEVAVSMGLASILGLALMQLGTFSAKTSKTAFQSGDVQQAQLLAQLIAASDSQCQKNFLGQTYPPAITVLKINGEPVLSVGDSSHGMKVSEIKLEPIGTGAPEAVDFTIYDASNPGTEVGKATRRYHSWIKLTLKRDTTTPVDGMGSPDYVRRTPVIVYTDNSDKVLSCFGEAAFFQKSCEELGGVFQNDATIPQCLLTRLAIAPDHAMMRTNRQNAEFSVVGKSSLFGSLDVRDGLTASEGTFGALSATTGNIQSLTASTLTVTGTSTLATTNIRGNLTQSGGNTSLTGNVTINGSVQVSGNINAANVHASGIVTAGSAAAAGVPTSTPTPAVSPSPSGTGSFYRSPNAGPCKNCNAGCNAGDIVIAGACGGQKLDDPISESYPIGNQWHCNCGKNDRCKVVMAICYKPPAGSAPGPGPYQFPDPGAPEPAPPSDYGQ